MPPSTSRSFWTEIDPRAFGPMPGHVFCRPRVGLIWQLDGRLFGLHLDDASTLVSGPHAWRVFSDRRDAWRWVELPHEVTGELDALVSETLAPPDLVVAAERAVSASPEANLRDVAHRVGVSARTLQRAIEARGLTFHTLRNRIRLDLALQLLARPELKLRPIARAVGFESTGHFIVWFRHQRGVTPGVHRASSSPE
ncbi:MAG: helix-turn-helix transcriptional regulator [Deltaproteobacteria bacterium]|nr:helix-turn-helix transcriptional regulator [Deltaproteobacteria bacterium]